MANSRYEYVKAFEENDQLLAQCWIVVRVDGQAFTKFSQEHGFEKPNDGNALSLMTLCAAEVMKLFSDVIFAYGVSDEYSFIFRNTTSTFQRRASKLVSVVATKFASSYVFHWPQFFPDKTLQYPPAFDGRAICYPTAEILKDYLSWRQVDCHINNQYNTCFWALVNSGLSHSDAQAQIKGTKSEEKNEMLFSRFGINYNDLPAIFKKGTSLYWEERLDFVKFGADGREIKRNRRHLVTSHEDIIKESFWTQHPHILQ